MKLLHQTDESGMLPDKRRPVERRKTTMSSKTATKTTEKGRRKTAAKNRSKPAGKTGLWRDNRSGEPGKLVGAKVLRRLERDWKERVTHEKGTTFSTPTRVFAARVCTIFDNPRKGTIHWCNISPAQLSSLGKYGKSAHVLFISACGKEVHYWAVAAGRVSRVLKDAFKGNVDTDQALIKIGLRGDQFRMGSHNVTDCHGRLLLNTADHKRLSSAITKARKAAAKVTAAKAADEKKAKAKSTKRSPAKAKTKTKAKVSSKAKVKVKVKAGAKAVKTKAAKSKTKELAVA
jgi:hypothetical protein